MTRSPHISATYAYWAAFNEGTLTPEGIGRTLVQFILVDEDGNTDLVHEFRAGKEPILFHRDGRLPVAEVMDLPNPVMRVCVR
jgi:hypothetical protein